jgi:hypothetical protein
MLFSETMGIHLMVRSGEAYTSPENETAAFTTWRNIYFLPFFDNVFLLGFFEVLFFAGAACFSNFFFILHLLDKIKQHVSKCRYRNLLLST